MLLAVVAEAAAWLLCAGVLGRHLAERPCRPIPAGMPLLWLLQVWALLAGTLLAGQSVIIPCFLRAGMPQTLFRHPIPVGMPLLRLLQGSALQAPHAWGDPYRCQVSVGWLLAKASPAKPCRPVSCCYGCCRSQPRPHPFPGPSVFSSKYMGQKYGHLMADRPC